MKPRSFSASALKVAAGCLSRYQAENIERGARVDNDAALLGTSCHAALEAFVRKYMENGEKPSLEELELFYRAGYGETFGTADFTGPIYDDGWEMLKSWFARTELGHVLSVEVKTSYPLQTSIGEIPFNYIFDRLDLVEEDVYRVVDYKSNRWKLSTDELRDNIQARMYGLMIQIMYPNAKKIWVTFDFLRHQPVGVVFTREDNVQTWKWLKAETERIINTPDDNVPETLNAECNWCIKKATCGALASNVKVGGIMSIGTPEELVELYARVEFQSKALYQLQKDLEAKLEAEARAADVFEIPGVDHDAGFVASSGNRQVDAARVMAVVGEDIFSRYGGSNITIGQFDKLLKDPRVDAETKSKLQSLVYKEPGEPRLKVKPKGTFLPK